MDICLECCVLSGRGLCSRTDHSSGGLLPTVVRLCVWFRNLVNEETPGPLGDVAPPPPKKQTGQIKSGSPPYINVKQKFMICLKNDSSYCTLERGFLVLIIQPWWRMNECRCTHSSCTAFLMSLRRRWLITLKLRPPYTLRNGPRNTPDRVLSGP